MFGAFVYEEIIPKDHPFRKLNEMIPWELYGKNLMKKYKGGGELGRAPYDPTLMLKMLFLKMIYGLDDRETERMSFENLPAKFFLGIAVNELPPDHTTLFKFQSRIDEAFLQKIMRKLLQKVKERNIHFGKSIIVDSTDVDAQTNNEVDDTDKKGGIDTDAAWGAKGGDKPNEPYYWYGYKMHSTVDADYGLFLSVKATPANVADNQCFKELVEGSMDMVTRVKKAIADRGYDDGDLFEWLKDEKIRCAIRMRDFRMKYEGFQKLSQQPWYKASLKERYKIERTQAWGKNSHRLQKSRAIGLKKTNLFCWLVALAVNIKRLLTVLFNVTLNMELFRKPALA